MRGSVAICVFVVEVINKWIVGGGGGVTGRNLFLLVWENK